jgi:heptose I phosphotransferase
VRTLQSWLRAKLGIAPGESAGRVEARNVGALAARGIEVMHLVAYGERLHGDGRWESFLLTEELAGYSELGHFLKRRFAAPAAQHRTGRDRDLRRLIDEVADIVGRLHAAGFNHRDLYCCHFLIKEPAPGQFDIRLIDLQRVQHRRRFRRRWVVKDLAQLAWSAPHECITCTRRMAFIRRYLGVRRLRAADKRLIREVLAKQQLMQRRLGVEA